MTTRLQRRLETLYGLERRKDKLGLEGTRALLKALGDPHTRFRSVHVAGTNGKGTTCAIIERVLREAGFRTGLYTSPHLVDFRERIRVRGRWVDEDWLEEALDRIESLPEARDRTFFEVATALGFSYFAEQSVEIAVVEVGLGGRLDCTNVITPEVSVITSLGLDHTEILGETLEEIAFEKAGIIKPGVPIVHGPLEEDPEAVVREAAERAGAPRLAGDGEEAQAQRAVARRALEVLRLTALESPSAPAWRGLDLARWPGRFEPCPDRPRLWWDGAHNADGIRWLGSEWTRRRPGPPGAVVLAASRDKDLPAMLAGLREAFGPLPLIATRSRSERAAHPEAIAGEARRQGIETEIASDVVSAVERGLVTTDGEVLLTGSLFAVGEAMEAFGGAPGEFL